MQHSASALHIQTTGGRSRYAIGAAFVVALHVVLIWALANGLAVKLGIYTPPVLETRVIDTPQVQPKQETPPPQPKMEQIKPTEQTPEPLIQIAPDPSAQTIQVPPQQQAPQMPVSASVQGLVNTHTTPPYPPNARRLGQEGRVVLSLAIGADGAITDAQVASTSGFPELDQAALEWVKAHWRYKPALQSGVAVTSTTQAAVKFDLKNP